MSANGVPPSGPWELPESVLKPGKVITDPVHGDIHVTRLELAIIDSRPFQRLRRIRQLGNTHLVYPGAVHSRFSHSLGALSVVQDLLDVIWKQSEKLHGVSDDLFAEWRNANNGRPDLHQWEQVKVLARLGALLHDLCHVPAGHTVEDDLGILEAHDKNEKRFEVLWSQLREDVPKRLLQLNGVSEEDCAAVNQSLLDPDGDLHNELLPLVISKGKHARRHKMEYPFCADLVGNTICADLLDYLGRDHLFAGLPESLGQRFTSAFFVTPSERGPFSKRLVLNIMRGDHERTDIVSELLKALRYRYELSERALVHHAKLAADAMLGESIERWEWALWWEAASMAGLLDEVFTRPSYSVDQVPVYRAELEADAKRQEMSEREWAEHPLGKVEKEVREVMEAVFRDAGDDGLLDFLVGLSDRAQSPAVPSSFADNRVRPVLKASARLAEDLQDRRLYRIAAQVGASDVSPDDVYKTFGKPAERAQLEMSAQQFASLGHEPRVILWIPKPDMRLKLAEVLVQQQAGIAPFVTYERSRSRRGSEIYDAHGRLWRAYVFVRRDVEEAEKQMISAFLGWRMGIRWEGHRNLGKHPEQWPLRLAVAKAFDAGFDSEVDKIFAEHGQDLLGVAARMPKTFRALERRVKVRVD
jgi:HD superfamily phosphohydrolase